MYSDRQLLWTKSAERRLELKVLVGSGAKIQIKRPVSPCRFTIYYIHSDKIGYQSLNTLR